MENLSDSEQSRILARVRKMMRLAEDVNASEGERDNALRMAHATLAKYNLDLASAPADDGKKARDDEPREQHAKSFLGYPWARQIANAAAKLFFCHYYYSSLRGRADVIHNFIGRHSNVVTAQEMARYLVESVHREARAYQRDTMGTQSEYTSFAVGATHKIYERCQRLRAEAEGAKPTSVNGTIDRSMSLAVIYRNEDEADRQFMLASGITTTAPRSNIRVRSEHALRAGAAYGSKVSLNRQLKV